MGSIIPVKQAIVVRKDLRMRRGKEIAQGSHASIAFLTDQIRKSKPDEMGRFIIELSEAERLWCVGLFTKVCLQVDSEAELQDLHQKAKGLWIASHLITDAGLTEFNGIPTVTALAIGPATSDLVDQITGHLKLY